MLCGYQNCFGNWNENENYNVESSIAFVRIKMKVEPRVKPDIVKLVLISA